MESLFSNIFKRIPIFKKQLLQIEELKIELEDLKRDKNTYMTWVPPGHYYSPIPYLEEIKLKYKDTLDTIPRDLPGINLNESAQVDLFHKFIKYYHELPFDAYKKEGLRYFFENPAYSYSDAIILYCMIRYAQPKKIIEVGSGYSSCVTLDVNVTEVYYDFP